MPRMTNGAAPCLSCRTTGGYTRTGHTRPYRCLGLCNLCYWRAKRAGVKHRYPACGFVPLPRQDTHPEWQPAPWGRVPFGAEPEVLPARWLGLPPYDARVPARLNESAHRRIAEAEEFAADWLRRHPDAKAA